MKGSLTVHSDGPGTGATFTLELPSSVKPTETAVVRRKMLASPATAPAVHPGSGDDSLSKLSLP